MPDAISRFTGFADAYDRARPAPPAVLVDVLRQWASSPRPSVVDVGAGTGLATAIWSGVAARVIAVEPSADMRRIAELRIRALPDAGAFTVIDATAEATGLPGGEADVVVASQAMHWFDPAKAIPEMARLLRPGGVFAAVDCDWPPCVDAEVDAAYGELERRRHALEAARGLRPPRAEKEGHLSRLAGSGLFAHTREICLHSRGSGDAGRLLAISRSQGGVVALLAAGVTEDELGLTALREVAERRILAPTPWWWTYRVRMAVR